MEEIETGNISILVFDKQLFVGTVQVTEPPLGELITVYVNVPHKDNGPLDIMYFSDLNYGIAITDKMVDYLKRL